MESVEKNHTYLIQVDTEDQPIGLVEKREAHLQGILHRAFSIFIFRKVKPAVQVLLQQRALHKYHSGGLWTNACCSHAEPGIPIEKTAQNRLQAEMGFSCPLSFVGSFYYKADVGNQMVEHEIDHVFAALHNPSDIYLNRDEANDYQWIDVNHLQKLIKPTCEKELFASPLQFTVWLPEALQLALKFLTQI